MNYIDRLKVIISLSPENTLDQIEKWERTNEISKEAGLKLVLGWVRNTRRIIFNRITSGV